MALGAIALKPAVVGDRVEAGKFIGMTIVSSHYVVDGAPVARFLQRLLKLMEGGYAF